MNEIAKACRELREIADAMPAGPLRDQMQADLINLRARLSTIPDRVAKKLVMQPKEIIEREIDREIRFAFADVLHWRIPK
jgi:hypothetical protein